MLLRLFGKIINTVLILTLIVAGYYYREPIVEFAKNRFSELRPCTQPLTYSIGTFDEKFGITKDEFLKQVSLAENIWEKPTEKELYQYVETGGTITLNLIYDYRQEATDKLKKIGILIDSDQGSYNALKARHEALVVSYTQAKASLDAKSAKFEKEKAAYETEVKMWNAKGGAPEPRYAQLALQKKSLDVQVAEINRQVKVVNQLVNDTNASVNLLNQLAKNLNLKVKDYNTVGSSTGSEFREGEYIREGFNRTINIYQFSNDKQLLRVMAHELGHAIGLDHIENPKAIMYYLNEGSNETATADDIDALKIICKIE